MKHVGIKVQEQIRPVFVQKEMVSRRRSLGPDPEMTIGDDGGFLEEGEGGDFAPSLSNNAATWPRVLPSNPS